LMVWADEKESLKYAPMQRAQMMLSRQ